MIRVNLLPIKEERRRSAGRIQLVVFAVVLALEIAGCVLLYVAKQHQVESMQTKVEEAETELADLKEKVRETEKREKRARKLKQKRDVLEKIERSAVGPGPMLEQLQIVLSEPASPQQRRAQRKKDWNVEWNPNHLWLKSFKESDNNFEVQGRALEHDDVGEFLHRLETTPHFSDVTFDYVRRSDSASGKIVEFRITGKAWDTPEQRREAQNNKGKNSKGT